MCKKVLPKMSDVAFLDQAAQWSKDITRMKSRGPGGTENAMRQIEREYGVDYGFLWSLRYRRDRLKRISKSVFDRIEAAYQAECQRQMRKLRHEVEITETIAGASCASVVEAKALVDEEGQKS